jgi:hypothetical protein
MPRTTEGRVSQSKNRMLDLGSTHGIAARECASDTHGSLASGSSREAGSRHVVPAFKPKAYQPRHWAERNLLQGVPYYFFPGPTFEQYLADNNVKVVMQENCATVRS